MDSLHHDDAVGHGLRCDAADCGQPATHQVSVAARGSASPAVRYTPVLVCFSHAQHCRRKAGVTVEKLRFLTPHGMGAAAEK